MNFGMNYNTETTFDYDSKKLKLAYEGTEDEIIKVMEAGNVSMNTSNSLIRGGAALFGIKTELQFGKLRVGAIFLNRNLSRRLFQQRVVYKPSHMNLLPTSTMKIVIFSFHISLEILMMLLCQNCLI